MSKRSAHEPEAEVMSAAEVRDDAQRLANVLRNNWLRAEHIVNLQIPLSVFLSALDNLSQDELMILRRRVEERLATRSFQLPKP